MLVKVTLVLLLFSAPIIEAQVAAALIHSLTTLATAPAAIIDAAVPFNCEVEQAKNAANLFNKLAQNLISLGKPASQGAINTLATYVGQLLSWPWCWAAEAGRVTKTASQLVASGSNMFSAASVLALLLSASTVNAQTNPITAVANAATTLINAAQPFNCEVTQAANAVAIAQSFVDAAQQYLANPTGASQDLINSITTYATQLALWPLCWAAEAERVAAAANSLAASGFSG